MQIELGQSASDIVTGFSGAVIGKVKYITGCNQSLLQPRCKENGDYVESRWIDDDRLKSTGAGKIELQVIDAGPDKPAPRR